MTVDDVLQLSIMTFTRDYKINMLNDKGEFIIQYYREGGTMFMWNGSKWEYLYPNDPRREALIAKLTLLGEI